jgi:hypothetical protein
MICQWMSEALLSWVYTSFPILFSLLLMHYKHDITINTVDEISVNNAFDTG